jgi:hypothetical protein
MQAPSPADQKALFLSSMTAKIASKAGVSPGKPSAALAASPPSPVCARLVLVLFQRPHSVCCCVVLSCVFANLRLQW